MIDLAIVGAGPAGLMAGIAAGRRGAHVLLLERNEAPARKLLLTGGGRCNLTHAGSTAELVDGLSGNGRFLYPALAAFGNDDLVRLLGEAKLKTMTEEDGRVFPRSQRVREVRQALVALLTQTGAELRPSSRVVALSPQGETFRLETEWGTTLAARKVILATGGLSYPTTGSTGDGLALAEQLGHRIIPPRPALVGLLTQEEWSRSIPGTPVRGVTVRLSGTKRAETGDLLFTHFGISGPAVLNLSRYAVAALAEGAAPPVLTIATDSSLSLAGWESRVEKAVAADPHRNLAGLLSLWWPKRLAAAVLGDRAGQVVTSLTREQRREAAGLLHSLEVTVTGARAMSEALVTQGGVDTRQVDPRSMQSRLVPGLYFAGELLDVDGRTGGFNLQAAFSSGHLAGDSAAAALEERY